MQLPGAAFPFCHAGRHTFLALSCLTCTLFNSELMYMSHPCKKSADSALHMPPACRHSALVLFTRWMSSKQRLQVDNATTVAFNMPEEPLALVHLQRAAQYRQGSAACLFGMPDSLSMAPHGALECDPK